MFKVVVWLLLLLLGAALGGAPLSEAQRALNPEFYDALALVDDRLADQLRALDDDVIAGLLTASERREIFSGSEQAGSRRPDHERPSAADALETAADTAAAPDVGHDGPGLGHAATTTPRDDDMATSVTSVTSLKSATPTAVHQHSTASTALDRSSATTLGLWTPLIIWIVVAVHMGAHEALAPRILTMAAAALTAIASGRRTIVHSIGRLVRGHWRAVCKMVAKNPTAFFLAVEKFLLKSLTPILAKVERGPLKWVLIGVSITAQVACAFLAPRKVAAWSRYVAKSTNPRSADATPYYFVVVGIEALVLVVLRALAALAARAATTLGVLRKTAPWMLVAAVSSCIVVAVVQAATPLSRVDCAALSAIGLATKALVLLCQAPAAADVEGNPDQGAGAKNPHSWVPPAPGLCSDVSITAATHQDGAATGPRDACALEAELVSTQARYAMLAAIHEATVAQLRDADDALASERAAAAAAQLEARQREEHLEGRIERVQVFGRRMIAAKHAADVELAHTQAQLAAVRATTADLAHQLDLFQSHLARIGLGSASHHVWTSADGTLVR